MKSKKKPIIIALIILAMIAIVAMVLLIKAVSDVVAGWFGKNSAGTPRMTGAKLRGYAENVAGIVIAVMLVTWGIATLSIPVLGGAMIVAGLGMLVWNVYPFIQKSSDLDKEHQL